VSNYIHELLQQLEVIIAGNAEQVANASLLETAKQEITDLHSSVGLLDIIRAPLLLSSPATLSPPKIDPDKNRVRTWYLVGGQPRWGRRAQHRFVRKAQRAVLHGRSAPNRS
jgi:hypothetical protein